MGGDDDIEERGRGEERGDLSAEAVAVMTYVSWLKWEGIKGAHPTIPRRLTSFSFFRSSQNLQRLGISDGEGKRAGYWAHLCRKRDDDSHTMPVDPRRANVDQHSNDSARPDAQTLEEREVTKRLLYESRFEPVYRSWIPLKKVRNEDREGGGFGNSVGVELGVRYSEAEDVGGTVVEIS